MSKRSGRPYHDVGRVGDYRPLPDDVRATIRLDQVDIDALRGVDEKPTKRAPGHWRCVFWLCPEGAVFSLANAIELGDALWLSSKKWPSEEMADEQGRSTIAQFTAKGWGQIIRYVRAEYFPEYP